MKTTGFAKIVATLGPTTSSQEKINQLVEAGVSVFRLNFSHGAIDKQRDNFESIRNAEKKYNRHLATLFDLQGPKLRVGNFVNGEAMLVEGNVFNLDLEETLGDENRAQLPHPEIFQAMKEGMDLLVNDGKIRLRVERFDERSAQTRVVVGGLISNHKGVNVPGVRLPISALTEKDIIDLKSAVEIGADWIALSFVQHPDDVRQAKELIGGKAALISKIEKPSAIEHLEEIVEESDGIMVARGDLGVEAPIESVPVLQKRIVKMARAKGKPVIVATQMLESMITTPTPTRAEASDVATAVYDGADAVMLSGETAMGQYPIEAVSTMQHVIREVENDPFYLEHLRENCSACETDTASAITAAVARAVQTLNTEVIVTYSVSGGTTLRMAKERPGVQILAITPEIKVARKMALVWGVVSSTSHDLEVFEDIHNVAINVAKEKGLVRAGDKVVVTAGVPFKKQGTTNVLHIADVE